MKRNPLDEITARKICAQWGVPYWMDAAEYPKGKISDEQWRWEFLRRDQDYREDWQKICIGEFSEILPERLIEYGLIELQDPRKSYKKLKTKIVFQTYPIILDENGNFEGGYYDINERQTEEINRILERENDQKHFINVKFNLMRPLAPQIEKLKHLLENKQYKLRGSVPRQRVSNDPALYLRTLDAFQVSVDSTTIGFKIFGCETKASAATRGRQAQNKVKKLWQSF